MSYATKLIDPPWPERGGGKIKRGADRHYSLLNVRDMPSVIIGSGVWRPAPNAHLYMWVSNNYLPDGLWLGGALGFRYVTNVVWPKPRAGLGQYFRGKHELLLFFVRGSGVAVRTETKSLTSVLETGMRERVHSRKPPEAYELIEQRSKGPYLEMFARQAREGWDRWGYEAPGAEALEQVRASDVVEEHTAERAAE
jgi:N6-adenosine-specific RNA methylase IME4